MSLVYGDCSRSLENRERFLSSLGIDFRDLVCGQQVHSSSVCVAKEHNKGMGALSHETALPRTDAIITDQAGVPIAVFTADCLSVFLYDRRRPACGVVHAGWRSTKECITGRTLEHMSEVFGTEPSDVEAGFGPCMRGCCLEVGGELRSFFDEGLEERNGRLYLDLVTVNTQQLLEAGVKKEAISDTGLCTSCRNDEFFSYRKEGASCGRMISVAMLR